MKKVILVAALATFKVALVVVLATAGIGSVSAQQTYKFGHIDGQLLLSLMPERDSAASKYMAYGKDLEEMLDNMQVELRKMVQEYQQKSATWSDAIRGTKEKDLQDKQQRIQDFQSTAAEDLQKRQVELMQPVLQKAKDAIKKVGKDNGFTYIYDISTQALVYWDEATSVNVLDMVKKELGIPANKVAPSASPTR